MVKTAASNILGKKLAACNRAVKWSDEEAKEAVRARRNAHA